MLLNPTENLGFQIGRTTGTALSISIFQLLLPLIADPFLGFLKHHNFIIRKMPWYGRYPSIRKTTLYLTSDLMSHSIKRRVFDFINTHSYQKTNLKPRLHAGARYPKVYQISDNIGSIQKVS